MGGTTIDGYNLGSIMAPQEQAETQEATDAEAYINSVLADSGGYESLLTPGSYTDQLYKYYGPSSFNPNWLTEGNPDLVNGSNLTSEQQALIGAMQLGPQALSADYESGAGAGTLENIAQALGGGASYLNPAVSSPFSQLGFGPWDVSLPASSGTPYTNTPAESSAYNTLQNQTTLADEYTNIENYLFDASGKNSPDLFGQITSDIAMAVLAAGTAGVLGPALGSEIAGGAMAGEIVGGPEGALTGAVGGAAGGLGTAGSTAAGAAEGAATSAIAGKNALVGAAEGAASGAASSASGALATPEGGSGDLTAGTPTDTTQNYTPVPDTTASGGQSFAPGSDASTVANYLNPSSQTPQNDVQGVSTPTDAGSNSSVAPIGQAPAAQTPQSQPSAMASVAPAALSAGLPAILAAFGLNGASQQTGGSGQTSSTSATTGTPQTDPTQQSSITLTPDALGLALSPDVEYNPAAGGWSGDLSLGGQTGYGSGSRRGYAASGLPSGYTAAQTAQDFGV